GKRPAHAAAETRDLGERRARDRDHRRVARGKMRHHAVGVVGHVGAALAARLPARRQHELLHDELRAAAEQVGERGTAVRPVEDIRLVDAHPGQLPAQARDLVGAARQVLLGGEQVTARVEPLVARSGAMRGHVFLPFRARRLAEPTSWDRFRPGRGRRGSDKCGGISPGGYRMDSVIAAAARGLAAGDPLGALNYIALRDDPPALALRGIAMAQLGDLARAKLLLKRAGKAFGPKEAVARARCAVAEAEIALVSRDLAWPVKTLEAARATLEARGDRVNAAHARHLIIRRLILIGRLAEAERLMDGFDPSPLPPALRAAHELVAAGLALRRLKTKSARAALARAATAARAARITSLVAEVEATALALATPAARLIAQGEDKLLRLDE